MTISPPSNPSNEKGQIQILALDPPRQDQNRVAVQNFARRAFNLEEGFIRPQRANARPSLLLGQTAHTV